MCWFYSLKDIEKNTYQDFSFNNFKCKAKVVDVYDGDTGRIVFKYHGKFIQYKYRLLGVDTPELKPLKSIPDREKIIFRAKEAKKYVEDLLLNQIVKVRMYDFDKYGRILIDIYPNKLGKSINGLLIDKNLAVNYDGKKKLKTL